MADFVLGVAGHVDHGKTALTYALTGMETDRLAEEKRRGLTIEPGFAPLPLPGGGLAALVDVPGHEKFIRNMLSGAAGLDAVLLVVAADDGVMPQTREHLDICTMLGLELGLVAITKADLADRSRLARVEEEVRALTAGTFLAGAPLLPVSARTGEGLEELRAALAHLAERIPPRPVEGPFRLNIDRVFSKDGFGTIVTGTLLEGPVSLGEEALLYPAGRAVRLRAIQSHGLTLQQLEPGHRAALNLAGVDREEVGRGDILAAPGSMSVTQWAEGILSALPNAPPLKTGSKLWLHHGAGQVLCRCTLRGRAALSPGEDCPVRLRLDAPMAARVGDRFLLRTLSPAATVGGGVLLALSPAPRVAEVRPDPLALLADYHIRYPLREGMNLAEMLARWGGTSAELVGLGVRLRGGLAALPSFRPKYSPELARLRDRAEVYYRRAGLEPAGNTEADATLDREVVVKLLRDGVLLPLGPEHRIHRRYNRLALETLFALRAEEGTISLPRYRGRLGVSRAAALLLLESFDRAGITVRQGDLRTVTVDAPPG